MRSLREVIAEARSGGKAVGHFNVSNLEMLHGVAQAAKNLGLPVIIGVSEGEREAMGVEEVVALVKSIKESDGVELFLNADHTSNLDKAKAAIAAGFDAVLADGSKLGWEENLEFTKEVVAAAKASGRDILVEGELGQIGSGSEVREVIAEELKSAPLTTPAQAAEFINLTSVDLLAPAVGNFHGMLKSGSDPALNLNLITELVAASPVPLILHGASGNSDEEVRAAIKAGMAVVHVSTELRVAYREALEQALDANPNEAAPYKFSGPAVQAVQALVEQKLTLFNSID